MVMNLGHFTYDESGARSYNKLFRIAILVDMAVVIHSTKLRFVQKCICSCRIPTLSYSVELV